MSESAHLRAILNTWREWPVRWSKAPRIVKRLGDGKTNASYLLRFETCRGGCALYCLRLNNAASSTFGFNREHERVILLKLSDLNIAPSLVYSNTNLNYSLFEYIQGRTWSFADLNKLDNITRINRLITRYQTQSVALPRFDYASYLNRYLQTLKLLAPGVAEKFELSIHDFIGEFSNAEWQPVLCHHDLVPGNVIEAEHGLAIIDWEYAGLGHPEFDARYMEHLRSHKVNDNPDCLLDGDSVDRLIYWINTLWLMVSKYAA